MKSFLIFILASVLVLLCPLAQAEMTRSTTASQALVDWVIDNAQDTLSLNKAKKFVTTAIRYANKHSLDPLLVLSIIRNESGFREQARSSGGAKGLMQVIPFWHKDKLQGRNPYDTNVSIEVGTQILKDCWVKHDGNALKATSCYSGGGGKKYYQKINTSYLDVKRFIVEQQFLNEEPITVLTLGTMDTLF
jgi:soluble lytic murein transglycosylase-like protein